MSQLKSCCPVCNSTKNLLRCQGCMVMFYCCRDHQVVDRRNHKRNCNGIKKSRENVEHEERELRAIPPSFMMPANFFEESVGHFWGIVETRSYMDARYGLVENLLKIKNFAAVQTAFDHIMDMLRLCRGDNMGLRDVVPAVFLRLSKDQECYDFIKWHATTGSRGDFDWGDMSLPFLDVRNADVFESVDLFIGEYAYLSHALALLLIKMKVLRDVESLHNAYFLNDRVAQELVDRIREELVGTIVLQNKDIMNSENQLILIKKLKSDLEKLFKFVKKSNKYFWPALLNPDAHLAARSCEYSMGSKEHAQITLQNFYDAWVETPGAIDMIKGLIEKDK